MLQQIFLGFIGLCSGFIIAGGLIGLLIGLSIVPRYAGITHTADISCYMRTLHYSEQSLEICSISFNGTSLPVTPF